MSSGRNLLEAWRAFVNRAVKHPGDCERVIKVLDLYGNCRPMVLGKDDYDRLQVSHVWDYKDPHVKVVQRYDGLSSPGDPVSTDWKPAHAWAYKELDGLGQTAWTWNGFADPLPSLLAEDGSEC